MNIQMTSFQDTYQSKGLCRICLSTSDQMLALHEELGPHTSISVLTALQSVMAVKLNESKAYPQSVCSICLSSLTIAYVLKLQYHESDKRITSLLNKAMEELPAIIKVENERVTSGDTVVELTEGQSKYLDSNIDVKGEISDFSDDSSNHGSIKSVCEQDIKQEIGENCEVPDDVSAEDISTLSHDFKIEIEECDLSQIKMETEESNSTSTSSEQTKHVTNNTLEDDLCVEQPEQFICASCNKSFTSKYNLIQHIEQHKRKNKPNNGKKAHVCQYCPYKTGQAGNLTTHMLTHTGEKTQACQYCPYTSLRLNNLRRHILTHTGERAYACQYCPYTAIRASHLKLHMLTHTGEKPHACQYCPYKARTSCNLKNHILIHTGEKTHACQYCPYKALRVNDLKKHILSHSMKKIHVCQYCPYEARDALNLKRHVFTHTKEKAHACQYCPHRTLRLNQLKSHMLTHTGEKPYACQYCPYKTIEKHNLKSHLLTHTGEKPHACQYCPYKTGRVDYLKKHILTHFKRRVASSVS